MIDEAMKRRPERLEKVPATGFLPGAEVQLADGQIWHFRRPTLAIEPRFVDGEVHLVEVAEIHGDDEASVMFAAEIVRLHQATAEGDDASLLRALMGLGAALLRPNYDLDDLELAGLLRWRRDDDASNLRLGRIHAIATGRVQEKAEVAA